MNHPCPAQVDPAAAVDVDADAFPARDCRTPQWLAMLRDLGLKRRMDSANFLDAARAAAAARDARAARKLLVALYADHALATDEALLSSLASVALSLIHI